MTSGSVTNTVHLGVKTRVKVTGWAAFAVAVQISKGSIDKGCAVNANSVRAVSSIPVAVAVTLSGVTTRVMSGTVAWARCTCEAEDGKESKHFHY